jgi:hypothetical protein
MPPYHTSMKGKLNLSLTLLSPYYSYPTTKSASSRSPLRTPYRSGEVFSLQHPSYLPPLPYLPLLVPLLPTSTSTVLFYTSPLPSNPSTNPTYLSVSKLVLNATNRSNRPAFLPFLFQHQIKSLNHQIQTTLTVPNHTICPPPNPSTPALTTNHSCFTPSLHA